MFKNMRKPVQTRKPVEEIKIDSNKFRSNLNKVVQGIQPSKSSRSSASRASYNYSSYYSKVFTKLYDLWAQPNLGGKLAVTVELTISKSGRVIAKRIIKRSGSSIMDNSIKSMLANLSTLPALPSTSTDRQLTVEATFVLDN